MLQVVNGNIQENLAGMQSMTVSSHNQMSTGAYVGDYQYQPPLSNTYWPYQTVYWNSYPVYICQDKTKKAIEVLKALQAEKLLKCESVPRFISLVEMISALL